MGEHTTISWCHHTFNPWVGCTKVSPACDHCYAEAWAKRTGQAGLWQGERRHTSDAYWRQPLKWNRDAAAISERRRVFCASLADIFDNKVPSQWRAELFELIRTTPNLDWLLLTKRPQNVVRMLPKDWQSGYRNVWLGTTVENRREAARRLPYLVRVPAVVRFVSYEPALERVDFMPWLDRIHWIIAGGENSGGARPSDAAWFRDVQAQCASAGVAFFFKQAGAALARQWRCADRRQGTDASRWPAELRRQEFPTASPCEGADHGQDSREPRHPVPARQRS
jgi:protein gp37